VFYRWTLSISIIYVDCVNDDTRLIDAILDFSYAGTLRNPTLLTCRRGHVANKCLLGCPANAQSVQLELMDR